MSKQCLKSKAQADVDKLESTEKILSKRRDCLPSMSGVKSGEKFAEGRDQPAPLWLEERIREALTEPAELTTREQFKKDMTDIANGR